MSVARDVPAVINATMEHAETSCPVAAFCHLAHSGHMTYVASFIEAAMNQDCGRGCWREIVMDDKGIACLFVLVREWVVHHARRFEEKKSTFVAWLSEGVVLVSHARGAHRLVTGSQRLQRAHGGLLMQY